MLVAKFTPPTSSAILSAQHLVFTPAFPCLYQHRQLLSLDVDLVDDGVSVVEQGKDKCSIALVQVRCEGGSRGFRRGERWGVTRVMLLIYLTIRARPAGARKHREQVCEKRHDRSDAVQAACSAGGVQRQLNAASAQALETGAASRVDKQRWPQFLLLCVVNKGSDFSSQPRMRSTGDTLCLLCCHAPRCWTSGAFDTRLESMIYHTK